MTYNQESYNMKFSVVLGTVMGILCSIFYFPWGLFSFAAIGLFAGITKIIIEYIEDDTQRQFFLGMTFLLIVAGLVLYHFDIKAIAIICYVFAGLAVINTILEGNALLFTIGVIFILVAVLLKIFTSLNVLLVISLVAAFISAIVGLIMKL